MEFLTTLWLPIILSAVFVFVVSSIIHMALKYHKNDMRKLPDENGFIEAVRKLSIPPGDYFVPYMTSSKDCKSPEFNEKLKKGPVAFITVFPNGDMRMGKSLVLWFIYSIVVSIFAAYITFHAVPVGGNYLQVFRFAGCSAFMAYSFALAQGAIWYGKNCGATMRSMFDGLIYGLVTAGVFGWLWPR